MRSAFWRTFRLVLTKDERPMPSYEDTETTATQIAAQRASVKSRIRAISVAAKPTAVARFFFLAAGPLCAGHTKC
jgi:hypothetical protein